MRCCEQGVVLGAPPPVIRDRGAHGLREGLAQLSRLFGGKKPGAGHSQVHALFHCCPPPHGCRGSRHGFGLAQEEKPDKTTAWIENREITRVVGKSYTLKQCFCSSSPSATLEAPDGDNLRELCKNPARQGRFSAGFSLLHASLPVAGH